MGHVYWPNGGVLPEEKTMLVGALVLEKKSAKLEKQDKRFASSFYELKGHVDQLMERIGIDDFYYDTFKGGPIETSLSLWHGSRSAEIKIEGDEKTVGYMGEINPLVLAKFDIHTRVVMFEFDLDRLNDIAEQEREYSPIRKYPLVTRDISLVANGDMRVDDILQTIQEAGGELVLDVDLFDVIDFADSTTSFAFHIQLGADDHTLTGKEIDDAMNTIIESLEKQNGIKVRK
jgi:phenylalanyl-tRNA synthetase beta chain